jgi:L-aminopeptidase/D-esterase-like protein
VTRINLLTDVAGLGVGHADDAGLGSGVTVVLFDRPAVASVSILGGAPGGRETSMLGPGMTVDEVDAVVLSGGSAFGLDAAGGVQAALRERGRGFAVAGIRVPIVPQAILFDLANGGNKDWGRYPPYRELGHRAACVAANGSAAQGVVPPGVVPPGVVPQDGATSAMLPRAFALGSFGAGMGATTGTVKGGLGSASTVTSAGHTVGAIAVVNAIGSATIGDGPAFWAAPFEQAGEFGGLGWPAAIDSAPRLKSGPGTGTTIGLIATDAVLTKAQARRLAIMAHGGLARAVFPAHAPLDGDTIFAAATGRRPLGDALAELTDLGIAAIAVMARAIARGVFEADSLSVANPQPSWRERFQ